MAYKKKTKRTRRARTTYGILSTVVLLGGIKAAMPNTVSSALKFDFAGAVNSAGSEITNMNNLKTLGAAAVMVMGLAWARRRFRTSNPRIGLGRSTAISLI